MDDARRIDSMPALDDPWRRLPWVVPMALSVWMAVLFTFSIVMREPPVAPPEMHPLDAQLIELPPPKPVVEGLTGGSGPASPPVARPRPHPQPKPIVRRPPAPVRRVRPREALAPPPARSAPISKPAAAPASAQSSAGSPASGAKTSAAGGGSGGITAPGGTGSGGIGSAVGGARAIYAPMPTIPDYLRQNPLNTVAVARFEVDPSGKAQVTLVQPTPDPRLNYLLLAKLKQWEFFPAVKDGKPVASVFSVRIPIVVR